MDEIISQLIHRRDGAECAGALAELSIQSPPQPGSKEARRWHVSRKLISPHAFHHSHITEGGEGGSRSFRAAPTLRTLALCRDVFVPVPLFSSFRFVADLSLP